MHKSQLAGFIIDCRTDDLPDAAAFWGAALGMAVRALPGEEGEKYVRLVDPAERLHVEVQKVTHESRVHLDIETDDIEAMNSLIEMLPLRCPDDDGSVALVHGDFRIDNLMFAKGKAQIAAIVDWGLGQGWPASRRWVCEL